MQGEYLDKFGDSKKQYIFNTTLVLSTVRLIVKRIGTTSITLHRRVQRGGGQGVLTPPFPGPPFSSVTPPPTQPDLTDKCNVNCFLIVLYAV